MDQGSAIRSVVVLVLVTALSQFPQAQAATEGPFSTFFGDSAGAVNSSDLNDNTFIGASAGKSNTTGHSNTFMGDRAGTSNTTASFNTFVGQLSGRDNTTGTLNTFVGVNTGRANTVGGSNTFVGVNAGIVNTTGNENVFLGLEAGNANTTGSHNTFLGFETGLSNAAGSNSTFVGYKAGKSNTDGVLNTFVGFDSGGNNTTGNANTFVGDSTGLFTTTGTNNVFLGVNAGLNNTVGADNTFVGTDAGFANNSGERNTYVGSTSGPQAGGGGSGNVFIGFRAGLSELASNRLYVDNCFTGGGCTSPLIYGEFDNFRVRLNGMTEVHFNGQAKSQFNFSQSSTDTGGYLTSVLDNNFFMSSGARFDGTLASPAQWVQRSPDGNAVIAGSGGAGYRIFTSSGKSVNTLFIPTVRLHINYAGEFGINQAPVAGHEIHTSSGAFLASGTWTNASSREYKENIHDLAADAAAQALAALTPVTFNYRTDTRWKHVGFIAEDVPDLVASPDRKGLSPMDIVAVLTRVVQKQEQVLKSKSDLLDRQQETIEAQQRVVAGLAAELRSLREELREAGRLPR
jgi:hypothetical protein